MTHLRWCLFSAVRRLLIQLVEKGPERQRRDGRARDKRRGHPWSKHWYWLVAGTEQRPRLSREGLQTPQWSVAPPPPCGHQPPLEVLSRRDQEPFLIDVRQAPQ